MNYLKTSFFFIFKYMEASVTSSISAKEELPQTLFVIKQSQTYSGLNSTKNFQLGKSFWDPIYKFPVIYTKDCCSVKGHYFYNELTHVEDFDIKDSILSLKETSPFRRTDDILYTEDMCTQESLKSSTTNLKKLSELPTLSPNLSVIQKSTNTFSSLSSFCSDWDTRKSCQLEEVEEDSSPEEEVPISHCEANRLFLNGMTASKTKFSDLVFEVPESSSPLLRKFVVCRQVASGKLVETREGAIQIKPLQIEYSMPFCGFVSAPCLEFWTEQNKSKSCSKYKAPLTSFFSSQILLELKNWCIKWVTCGYEHCAAVTTEGKVLTWGFGGSGCLGHGNTYSCCTPNIVNSLFDYKVTYIQAGGYHNAAVTSEGAMFVWGRSDVHQLGISLEKLTKDSIGHYSSEPLLLDYFCQKQAKVSGVACGEAHTIVLDSKGKVYCFGWGEDGQLGVDPCKLKQNMMTDRVLELCFEGPVSKVAAGGLFSSCLVEGEVFVFGNGEQGQLGLGSKVRCVDFPSKVELKDQFVVDICCGETWTVCLTAEGKLFGWGQGKVGRFKDSKNYPEGSDVVCAVPKQLYEAEIAHKLLIS